MVIQRSIKPYVLELLESFRMVSITGARQSGKTTLSKEIAEELGLKYYTMDNETLLLSAKKDPLVFAKQLAKTPCVIDEVQMATELIKALKIVVDEENKKGMFLLTGSADLFKMNVINESLAGRVVSVNLFTFSQYEINNNTNNFIDMLFNQAKQNISDVSFKLFSIDEQLDIMLKGGFPDVYNKSQRIANSWFDSYISARIEKDLSLIKRVSQENKSEIFKLLALLANNNSNLLKYNSLSNHLSIKDMTVKSDIEILEALYLIKRLNPYFTNRGKREIKTPKIHFMDTGLASHIVGIDKEALILTQRNHLGNLVENFIYTELLKHTAYSNKATKIYHYRDDTYEVDFVIEQSNANIIGIEAKSSTRIRATDLRGLVRLAQNSGELFQGGFIFYMGEHIVPMSKDGYSFLVLPISMLLG